MSDAPLPNSSDAREPDGTIKDQALGMEKKEATPQPEPEKKSDEKTSDDGKSALNKDDKKPEVNPLHGAPEKYEFKAPEGRTLDQPTLDKAMPLFKELNLSQAGADKLVGFYNDLVDAAREANTEAYKTMRAEWRTALEKDPEIGGKLPEVKETIGRMYDAIGKPELVKEFREVMDVTGAGDHPAFAKIFFALAQAYTEGKVVKGGGPSPLGQQKPGSKSGPSASAMYPNLPSANPQQG